MRAHATARDAVTMQCLFCPSDADSGEDLFPKWLNRAFPNPTQEFHVVTKRIDGVETFGRSRQAAFIKIDCVCRNCNNTWMSRIEKRLKPLILPLIHGHTKLLSQADQLDLATWATLKTMVYERESGYPAVTTADDHAIMKREERPPAHARVYLAGHNGIDNGLMFAVHRSTIEGLRSSTSTDTEMMAVTTLVLGHLVLQTVVCPTTSFEGWAESGIASKNAMSIVPPIIAGASFPPTVLLDDEALSEFASSHVQIANRQNPPQPAQTP